jgi:hypothetical protein
MGETRRKKGARNGPYFAFSELFELFGWMDLRGDLFPAKS